MQANCLQFKPRENNGITGPNPIPACMDSYIYVELSCFNVVCVVVQCKTTFAREKSKLRLLKQYHLTTLVKIVSWPSRQAPGGMQTFPLFTLDICPSDNSPAGRQCRGR